MKSKKILIAALSLGLIFAPTKPLVFAADAEQAEVDFATKRLNLIHKQEIVKKRTENEYNKIKAISDEALKILNSENRKKADLERNIQNLKTDLEANPPNDRKMEIETEIINLENQLNQQNQKIHELDQDYKEKEKQRLHYDNIASPERYLLYDYRSANRDIDIEIADAKYQIRVFRNQGLLDDQETAIYTSDIQTIAKTENPEDYIKIYESARAKAEQKKAEKLAENPEIEPDDQTPDQNETNTPNEEELKAAKESAIENLKAKANLTEEQKKSLQEEINNAVNLEELAEINKKVDQADEEAARAKEISEAKDKAKQILECSENINSDQKSNFEKQIEDSNTIDQLLEIENNILKAEGSAIRELELKELEENKKILRENLNSKEILTQDQKEEFEKQIAEASDKETLAKIEEEITLAVEVANKEKEAQELENAKLTLEEKLENTSLSPEQKDAFKNRIIKAENQADLKAIEIEIDQANEEAAKAKELAEAKEKAKQSLENAKNINLEQKTNFEKQIEDAETVDQLLEIENNIKLEDEKAQQGKIAQELANSKQILEEKLENTILTQDQKDAFKNRILKAENQADLKSIQIDINQAEEIAKKEQELAVAKESALENLKAKSNLTEEQEKVLEEEINNAENLEELVEINKKVEEADEESAKAKELSEAKNQAKQHLENAENINSDLKADFEKQIEDTETVDQLLEIENNIKLADEKAKEEKIIQELENAKSALAEKLFATSLNQDQKDSFLEKINKAADLVDLDAIDKEIEIASNQVDENIENETEKDPSNEENPSIPDPEEEKPKDEEKDPSEENPNGDDASNLPGNQDENTTENPDPSNEDPVDDDNELENNPQNPDPDNGNNDSSDTSENVENTPTDNKAANGRENNTADGGNPEKTSPEGQRPRNTKITRPIFGNTNPVYRPLKSPHYLPSTITINETSTAKKVTIELKDDLKYLKKGTYKISDLEAKRDKIEAAIRKNKATVRAIGILEDLAPKTLAKNRAKINALLEQSQRLLAQANYALAEYNYLLSK